MFWIEDADAVSVMPVIKQATTMEKQFFQEGNPQMGKNATILTAEFMNMLQCELMNLVEGAGIRLEKGKLTQVLEAIKHFAAAAGGILPWDETATYDYDANGRLHHIVWATDNMLHIAVQPSGPGAVAGPQDPTTTEGYWLTLAKYLAGGGGGGGGGGSVDLVYPGAFHDFMEQMPPSGWMVRNGALVTNASLVVPELLAALQKPENGWKLLSESEWQAQSAATPWNGVGGIAKFVLDVTMDTIRLPDTRGMYAEPAGFNNLSPGGAHGDAIRNITGQVTTQSWLMGFSGAFTSGGTLDRGGTWVSGNGPDTLNFDASLSVPTSVANMPRAFGILGCVYVGLPAV